jgi:hypothetical protein
MALLRLNNFSERDLDLTLSYGAGLMLNQKLNSSHYVANGYTCQKPECGIITIRRTVIASFAKLQVKNWVNFPIVNANQSLDKLPKQ